MACAPSEDSDSDEIWYIVHCMQVCKILMTVGIIHCMQVCQILMTVGIIHCMQVCKILMTVGTLYIVCRFVRF